jgi:hypothetical protein
MKSSGNKNDIYKERLVKATNDLKDCQENFRFKSCFDCKKLFDCEIRKGYVNAVYSSMSKGQSGGFEF